jgi:hypothetical protein
LIKHLLSISIVLGFIFTTSTGCVSASTGRVRDAHLLYDSGNAGKKITDVKKFGPFYERVETTNCAVRTSYRPSIYTHIYSPNEKASATEILWPLYSSNTRGDYKASRFLIWFWTDFNISEDSSRDRYWLFPFFFWGTTKTNEDYCAFFPFYGTIREMYFDYISFTLWPVWMKYKHGSQTTTSVLWPIYSKTDGDGVSAIRVFPFYGEAHREGKLDSYFVLWPFWNQAKYYGRNPGSSWMLFPIAGYVDTENEERYLVLPPFFSFAYGRGKTPTYRNLNFPWPLFNIYDDREYHKRNFIPFYIHQWDDKGKLDSSWYLWPFVNTREALRGNRRENSFALNPIYLSSEIYKDADKDGQYETLVEDYMRIWPLYSSRNDTNDTYIKIPDFSLSRRAGLLSRNLLDVFTLYTYGHDNELDRTDHEFLWGLYSRGYGNNYSRTHIFPFYNRKREGDNVEWSIFYGLFGRRFDGEEAHTRYLWFFGD